MDCLFCKIADKQLASDLIYEDDTVVAFHDINPQAPTHIIIIPREHIATLNDLSAEHKVLMGHMVHTATRLAGDHNLSKMGYRVVMNCNAHGGQSVFHIHMHLLGGRLMSWPPG